jgi:flagellar basal-body rod protein FlgG
MMKGFYTATSGLINRGNVINTISNNIANSNTAGYKKDDCILKSFGEHMTYRLSSKNSAEIGQTSGGIVLDEIYTQYEQGNLQNTANPFDLAIEGEGFFTLQLANGERALTRNGQFQMSKDGYLIDLQGNMVLSTNGPLKIDTSNFYVINRVRFL